MAHSTVFITNRTQAVRLPTDVRFPDSVKKVHVRAVGHERVIAPANAVWDSFFLPDEAHGVPLASDDFMAERSDQQQAAREGL
jgi:antitoxin VapB